MRHTSWLSEADRSVAPSSPTANRRDRDSYDGGQDRAVHVFVSNLLTTVRLKVLYQRDRCFELPPNP
jgi:hypothetical protein